MDFLWSFHETRLNDSEKVMIHSPVTKTNRALCFFVSKWLDRSSRCNFTSAATECDHLGQITLQSLVFSLLSKPNKFFRIWMEEKQNSTIQKPNIYIVAVIVLFTCSMQKQITNALFHTGLHNGDVTVSLYSCFQPGWFLLLLFKIWTAHRIWCSYTVIVTCRAEASKEDVH